MLLDLQENELVAAAVRTDYHGCSDNLAILIFDVYFTCIHFYHFQVKFAGMMLTTPANCVNSL